MSERPAPGSGPPAAWVRSLRPRAADGLRRGLGLLRRRGRAALARALRLSGAAVLAYVVARALFPGTQPLTGPLTALLVVQLTLFNTLTASVRRVVSVVSGVVIAVVFSAVVGLTWWSLGAIIAAAILVGHLLRLGEHLLEVPISAMLVLGVGSHGAAGVARVAETLVGAAVGVLVNVVLPPPVQTRTASQAVERVALECALLLEQVADELPGATSVEQPVRWLEEFRRLGRHVTRADAAVEALGDSRRLNPRAVGTRDPQPVLRSGLDALEHSIVALRALFRSIADGVRYTAGTEHRYDDGLREAVAVLLQDLAAAMRSYGALVRAEAAGADRLAETELAATLEALREAQARVAELLLVDARDDRGLWEVSGALLAAVARVVRELDVVERARQRERWERDQHPSRAAQAVSRLRDTSRQVTEDQRRRLRDTSRQVTRRRWRPRRR